MPESEVALYDMALKERGLTFQAENVPCQVLDCCSGSGTTVLAAKKLGRRAVGIDLSEKYLALARRRLSEVPLALGLGI